MMRLTSNIPFGLCRSCTISPRFGSRTRSDTFSDLIDGVFSDTECFTRESYDALDQQHTVWLVQELYDIAALWLTDKERHLFRSDRRRFFGYGVFHQGVL